MAIRPVRRLACALVCLILSAGQVPYAVGQAKPAEPPATEKTVTTKPKGASDAAAPAAAVKAKPARKAAAAASPGTASAVPPETQTTRKAAETSPQVTPPAETSSAEASSAAKPSGKASGARQSAQKQTGQKQTGQKQSAEKQSRDKQVAGDEPASEEPSRQATAATADAAKPASVASLDEVDPSQPVASAMIDVAAWALASGDTLGLPFAVIDKTAAQLAVFGPDGRVLGLAPVLLGSAEGDHSAEGVADRELRNIPKKDRTTPAGRFIAVYGPAADDQRVLWIDWPTAISIHPIADTDVSRREKRTERLATPAPADNRITHGCLNVSPAFYERVVSPAFAEGGVFYIIPEAGPLEQALPGFQPVRSVASSEPARRDRR